MPAHDAMDEGPFAALRRAYTVWRASHAEVRPIHSVVSGARALIEGVVEVAEAQVTAPFTGQSGVLVAEVALLEKKYVEEGKNPGHYEWIEQFREVLSTPFFLVDDDGARACIEPRGGVVKLPLFDVSDHPHVNSDGPEIDAFLRRHGVPPTQFIGMTGNYQFLESVLAPGERVAVSAVVERRLLHLPAEAQGYRGGPVEVPVFAHGAEPLVILLPRR
jgi:hypothetical protein